MRNGDYVIIQFRYNKSKLDNARHNDVFTTYKENFEKYLIKTKKLVEEMRLEKT